MVESGGRAVGLVAEQLLGQQQVVIKSLGASGLRTPGIAGGAIMPDGRVGLVLDPQSLVQFACGSGREAA
jgi:two-component system chemotaxis sensor kinase CheA